MFGLAVNGFIVVIMDLDLGNKKDDCSMWLLCYFTE
jgi:hypothetical protein